MKKITAFLFGLALLSGAQSFAQEETTTPGVRFGLKAGINIANLSIKPNDAENQASSLISITGGVFATIPGGPGFAVQPELNYSGLGAKEKSSGGKVLLNYLTLPVLLKYSFESSGFGAYLGPQIGYLLSAKAKVGGLSIDAKDQIKKTDVAGIIGVEYFLPVGVGLSARYQLGFTNIAKETAAGESEKNKAITFTIGYRF